MNFGIIDKDGNNLIPRKELETSEQKEAYTHLDILIFNLKKLISKIPRGARTIATFSAALALLKEGENLDPDNLKQPLNEAMDWVYENLSQKVIEEEIANVVGSGEIKGAGPGEDPPVKKKKKGKVMRRKKAIGFKHFTKNESRLNKINEYIAFGNQPSADIH